MVIHNQTIESCREELRKYLKADEKEILDAFLCHIFERDTDTSLEKTIYTLLSGGCSLTNLTAGLLHCQQRHLEVLSSDLADLAPIDQHVRLRHLIKHYAGLQVMCLNVTKKRHAKAASKRSPNVPVAARNHSQTRIEPPANGSSEQQPHPGTQPELANKLEERTKEYWEKIGKIRLFNDFRGLLVLATAVVESVESYYATIELTPRVERVFACGKKMRFAYAETPEERIVLRMEIFGHKGNLATLRIAGVEPNPRSGRDQMRIGVSDNIPITIIRDGQARKDTFLLNFSNSGLCVRFEDRVELNVGDEVECVGVLRTLNLRALGVIRWIEPTESGARVGVELRLTPSERNGLRSVMTAIEKEIIHQLNQLGSPETLR